MILSVGLQMKAPHSYLLTSIYLDDRELVSLAFFRKYHALQRTSKCCYTQIMILGSDKVKSNIFLVKNRLATAKTATAAGSGINN